MKILCLFVLIFATNSVGQTTRPLIITPDTDRMMASAKQNGQAILDAMANKDYAKIADYTHPAALKMMGGREKAIAAIKQAMEHPEPGIQIRSNTVHDVWELVDTATTAYVVLPETLVMDVPGGQASQDSFLLGVSDDHGKSWTFIDGAGGVSTIKKLLPDLPATVVLPKRPQPTYARSNPNLAAGAISPTTMPAEIASLEPAAENWVGQFKGKTETEIAGMLGKGCKRSDWKSGDLGGLRLEYKVGTCGALKLMFSGDVVVLAYLDIEP